LKLDLKFGGYDHIVILIYLIIFSMLSLLTENVYILIILGLPFIFIFPGYLVVLAMFPERGSMNLAERIALTVGLSVFILPGLGLVLNFTPFGILHQSVLASVIIFSAILSPVIWYRRKNLSTEMMFPPALDLKYKLNPGKSGSIQLLLYIGIIVILVAIAYMFILFISIEQPTEKFTELEILDEANDLIENPVVIEANSTETFTLIIKNHEHEIMDYSLRLRSLEFSDRWTINDSFDFGDPLQNQINNDNPGEPTDLSSPLVFYGNNSYLYDFQLDDGTELNKFVRISFLDKGNYRLQVELYKNNRTGDIPELWIYIIIIVE